MGKLLGAGTTGGNGDVGFLEFVNGRNERRHSETIKQKSGFTINYGFGSTTGIVSNDRTTVSHGLNRNYTEIFVIRAKNKSGSSGHEFRLLLIGDFS